MQRSEQSGATVASWGFTAGAGSQLRASIEGSLPLQVYSLTRLHRARICVILCARLQRCQKAFWHAGKVFATSTSPRLATS